VADTEFLLVEVSRDWAARDEKLLAEGRTELLGVVSVSVHGGGCCCKNCPWDGDHG
jgi:hypothetical protein